MKIKFESVKLKSNDQTIKKVKNSKTKQEGLR